MKKKLINGFCTWIQRTLNQLFHDKLQRGLLKVGYQSCTNAVLADNFINFKQSLIITLTFQLYNIGKYCDETNKIKVVLKI